MCTCPQIPYRGCLFLAWGRRGRTSADLERRGMEEDHFVLWRGQPLVERFATNEELSAPLRQEIERLTNIRNEREIVRRRREANVGMEQDGSDEEDVFFDSEEFVWMAMNEWTGARETFLSKTSGPID